MTPDLSLLETDQLLEELGKRFDATVFVAVQFQTKSDDYVKSYYNGSTMACVGLVEVATCDVGTAISVMREPLSE